MLRKIANNLWVAEQPLRYFGLSVGTRMTVIRLANRELVVISPIEVSNAIADQLRELGTVKHVVAPNLYHYSFVTSFKTLYANATIWAVPGLKVKQPSLPIDRTIERDTPGLWTGLEHVFFDGFRTLSLNGFDALNECVFFHVESRTLILTDIAVHFDESFPAPTQLATRVLGGYKKLSPTLLERVATTDKENIRKSVKKILEWDFERVIMAHGSVVEQEGKEKFRQGYQRFLWGSHLSL